MEYSEIQLSNNYIRLNGKDLNSNYVVGPYNGISTAKIPCVIFQEFADRENIKKICNLSLEYDTGVSEILKQIFKTKIQILALSAFNWNTIKDSDKAIITKELCDRGYLFETNDNTLTAVLENGQEQPVKIPTVLVASESSSKLQQSGIKKKYRLECVIETDLDVKAVLQNTFGNVVLGKLTPIYEAIPIKLNNGTFKAPDYSLIVDSDGITLLFDYGENSRESGVEYSLEKNVDYVVEQWLETLDSEQLYILAQLTFTRTS